MFDKVNCTHVDSVLIRILRLIDRPCNSRKGLHDYHKLLKTHAQGMLIFCLLNDTHIYAFCMLHIELDNSTQVPSDLTTRVPNQSRTTAASNFNPSDHIFLVLCFVSVPLNLT